MPTPSNHLPGAPLHSTWLSRILAAICFLGGLWNCWRFCYAPDNDEIQYLNIGEAFLRGDGHHFLNGTWGPLFGVVSALWLRVLPQAYPREELKLLNLCVLLLVLWAALAMSSRIVGSNELNSSSDFRLLSSLFLFSALWVCLDILGVFRETPDLLLLAALLASALAYLRLFDHPGATGYLPALIVGACGAAGYYLKQSYLPVALLFLLALAWPPQQWRVRILRVAVAGAAFFVLLSPWVAGLSVREGRLTLGGNSKFNYFVNIEHSDPIAAILDILPPENRLSADPTVVDFDSIFPRAQCPLHFEGAWYLNNVPIQFDWKQQINQARINYIITLNLFRHRGPFGLLAALVLLSILCLRRPSFTGPWLPLMAISAAPFILYPLVHVEYRYLSPYLFLGGISAWAWVAEGRRNISRLCVVLLSCCLLGCILWDTVLELRPAKPREDAVSFACCVNPYAIFRNDLHAAGVPDGAKIALLGEPRDEHFYSWLNPGHYRLQAVITDPNRFVSEPPALREKIEHELSERGSVALVAPRELIPRDQGNDWQALNIGYVYRLLGNPQRDAALDGR